jgi:hypothetical protein
MAEEITLPDVGEPLDWRGVDQRGRFPGIISPVGRLAGFSDLPRNKDVKAGTVRAIPIL